MKDSYANNDFIYQVKQIDNLGNFQFRLDYPDFFKLDSDTIYKYYGFKEYNIDSFINSYLYACHPKELNDFYDLSGVLINYENVSEEIINQFINHYDPEFVKKSPNPDARIKYYNSLYQIIKFGKYGIISFSKRFDSILMWAYYGNHEGFCMGYKYPLFPNKDFYGPFPINYCKGLNKIDFSQFLPELCFHFQTNIKLCDWRHENEYRFVVYNDEGLYDPDFFKHDKEKRKHSIPRNAFTEIILGYNFFDVSELSEDDNIIRLDMNCNKSYLKAVLLEHIINQRMDCYRVCFNSNNYQIGKSGLSFNQVERNVFSYKSDNKICYYI